MIRVTVLYPAGPAFDMDYYLATHTPLVRRLMGDALSGLAIDTAIGGIAPELPPYQVICTLSFASLEAFQAVMAAHGATIMADIANFTAAQPVIQLGMAKA